MYEINNVIKKLYRIGNIYRLSDILSEINKNMEIDNIFVYYSLKKND